MSRKWKKRIAIGLAVLGVLALAGVLAIRYAQGSALRGFTNGRLEAADYWSDEPAILSAGMGFDNIIGLPEVNEDTVREAGGAWYTGLSCTNGEEPETSMLTSAASKETIERGYRGYADWDDGLPVVFSWPVATETVDPTDFKFTLNTGEVVFGHAAGMNPNWEYNERNTVVLFGDFGIRKKSSDPGARFPVKLEIVADETPLTLVGPGGQEVSAVGLSWTTDTSPYDSGPKLVGAKLNRAGDNAVGEGGVRVMNRFGYMPNDEFALYEHPDFRLRVLTTGGFSPDGVTALRPDMYEDFFRLHAKGRGGKTVLLDKTGVDYEVAGGTLRVVGLSDLGKAENHDDGVYYDDCYREDRDNYIDIILVGDQTAARSVTAVEIPALKGGYQAFYNPGGPGPTPTPGVRYSAPGPPDLEPVVIALDDPMRVSRDP
ncbi:MAG TPA: hypothetical protein VGU26_02100 [Gaiellaceae bacterium]|nr:hypothetical protein [Gaiellaceae bacterium]